MPYVELVKKADALRITLTPAGQSFLRDRLEADDRIGTDAMLYDLLEDHLCNGWEWIRPEEIGALTSAPIFSDDCGRDEDGMLTQVGAVYWFPDYQIKSPVEELFRHGSVSFAKAD
jgi:hypothetical protein